jgi:probable phosphoglycerate mutase
MVKIYLVRHGQSTANLNNVFLGQHDLGLTELGYEQAKITANFLKDIPVDAIYSSDIERAYHTAKETAKLVDKPIITDKGLREIDGGEWEELPFDVLWEKYYDSMIAFTTDIGNSKIEGGESVKELFDRFNGTVEKIAKENDGKIIFIFSHATSIRCFATLCMGKKVEEMKGVPWPNNASVTIAEYENGKFNLIEYGYDEFMGQKKTGLPKGY